MCASMFPQNSKNSNVIQVTPSPSEICLTPHSIVNSETHRKCCKETEIRNLKESHLTLSGRLCQRIEPFV